MRQSWNAYRMPQPTLLLVFNVQGGLIDRLAHAVRKRMAPADNPCTLCRLTRGPVRLLPRWKTFTRSLDVPVAYLHCEEFRGHYSAVAEVDLPAAFFCYEDDSVELAISREQIESCRTMEQLMTLVRRCVTERPKRSELIGTH